MIRGGKNGGKMTHRQTQLLENIINGELTLLSCKRTVTREDGDINENNVKICLKTVLTHMEHGREMVLTISVQISIFM